MTFFLCHLFDAVFEKKKPVISGGRQASFSEKANKDYLTRSRQCDYKMLSSDKIGPVILALPLTSIQNQRDHDGVAVLRIHHDFTWLTQLSLFDLGFS
jgi:hypothetical protein